VQKTKKKKLGVYVAALPSVRVVYKSHRSFLCLSPNFALKIQLAVSKGKAIPLQAWTDPKGSRRLRLPDFKTVGT